MDRNNLTWFLIALFTLATVVHDSAPAEPIALQPVDLVPYGESRFSGGVHFEQDRSLGQGPTGAQLEYDNTRFKAINIRMGILDHIELNMGVNHSNNSVDAGAGGSTGEGIEGIRLGTKISIHPNVSAQFTGKFNGESDVQPYGSSDPAISMNVPLKFKLGQGMFHSEAGFTIQSGQVLGASRTPIGRWINFINYGVGYSYRSNYFTDFSMEVVGHTRTAESTIAGVTFNDFLSLVFGADLRLARGVHLRPQTSFALLEGSPDVSFGFEYQISFEGRRLRRTNRDEIEDRFSDREAVGGAKPTAKKRISGERMKDSEMMEKESTDDRVNELMEKGFRAAENGNLRQAMRNYKKAEDLKPNSLLVQSNLGSLYYRMGKYSKARDHYKKAVNLNPSDTFSLLYLGASHYQLGNRDKARRYFNRVKKLDPDNKRVQRWLEKMN
ncbi:MAG: tetratricopeptide repeat protein [bacterium]